MRANVQREQTKNFVRFHHGSPHGLSARYSLRVICAAFGENPMAEGGGERRHCVVGECSIRKTSYIRAHPESNYTRAI